MSKNPSEYNYHFGNVTGLQRPVLAKNGEEILEMDEDEHISIEEVSRELDISEMKAEYLLDGLSELEIYDKKEDGYRRNGLPEDEDVRRLREFRNQL